MDKTQGLTCPECSGIVPVKEGERLVACPYCGLHSLIQGEQGTRRWQVNRRLEHDKARQLVGGFFTGIKKARDLKKEAQIEDMFLVYLPYWRVRADVAGWLFGRVRKDKDETKPVEVAVFEEMIWTDAALDVSEYGVHQVGIAQNQLEPYQKQDLHAEAIVFEPTESHTDALDEAHDHFIHRGRSKQRLDTTYFEKFHFLHEQLAIVYYPLWVARYRYHQRHYQVVVDGVNNEVLYGKAPGNIFYRAGALVVGLAAGNFVLVNGTILAAMAMSDSSDDDGLALLLLPIVLGIALIIAGYRSFRYGEEVEQVHGKVKKAIGSKGGSGGLLGNMFGGGNVDMGGLMKTGMNLLDEVSKSSKR
ncbi:MAG: hypothetical protein KF770_25290 [Anaerolineae bacterium]|nr:hypothetical protein [Anaerolineae bacterium]